MGIYFLVEEQSIQPVIDAVVPQLIDISAGDWYKVMPHQGKQDLQKALRNVIPALSKVPDVRIMIVHDQDDSDCVTLKQTLADTIERCDCPFRIRIVCRELESWFLGDLDALQIVFPRFNAERYASTAAFRNVDFIVNPANKICDIIPEYQNLKTLPKVRNAEQVAPFLDIDNNKSNSFQQFISGIRTLMNE